MIRDEWIRAFAAEIGVTAPTDAEIGQLLKLASIAAHASERPAAPLACFVAGRSDRPIADLVEAAQRVAG
jgi:hypothetical protein